MSDRPAALDAVIRDLEQESEILRLKKLLFLACTGHWESNSERVSLLDLRLLVSRLVDAAPNFESLRNRLEESAASLNKPLVYGTLASRAIQLFEQLYQVTGDLNNASSLETASHVFPKNVQPRSTTWDTETTVTSSTSGSSVNDALPPPPPGTSSVAEFTGAKPIDVRPKTTVAAQGTSYDWFSLRLDILRGTNPLRAKILCFFTLNPEQTFNGYSWASIKSDMLDRLLYRLFQAHPEVDALRSSLETTAKRFPDAEDYLQAADAVTRAMDRSVYSRVGERDSGESSTMGRYPGYDLFARSGDEVTSLTNGSDGEESGQLEEDGTERSIMAIEKAFLRS